MNKYENTLHQLTDLLLDDFNKIGASNYWEMTFGCNDDPSRSFVVTMQMLDGKTPCEKLSKAENIIEQIKHVASSFPKDKAILKIIEREGY